MTRIFFTDRDLGKRFPSLLIEAGLTVERHHDLFAPDGPDEQWLAHCGENRRIAITHDLRIRYKPNECDAVMRHRVRLLVIVGHAPYPDLAMNFLATLAKIEAFLDTVRPPFIAKVYRPPPSELQKRPTAAGTISLWYPK